MARDFAVRCTPANADPEFPAALVRDGSGEVLCFSSMDAAVAEALDRQDRAKSDVSYTVEPL